ncbi:hypothetical protein Tco_1401834, partial [Tanacetum coccineum]
DHQNLEKPWGVVGLPNLQSYSWKLVEGEGNVYLMEVVGFRKRKVLTRELVGIENGGKQRVIEVGGDRAQVYGVGKVGPPKCYVTLHRTSLWLNNFGDLAGIVPKSYKTICTHGLGV